tara:strand:+ start:5437 stop:5727 length:291 start_codon:yes stop_codon:yes gene_type:complete
LKLSKNKKSQGLSVNMIVLAAIALVVLVVTIIIITGQTSTTSKNLQSCALKGGKCAKNLPGNEDLEKVECNDGVYNVPVIVNDPLCGESQLCCLKL